MQVQQSISEPSRSEAVPAPQRRWLLAALVVLLSLLQPHTWPGRTSAVWMPATGIVFALGVWRGYRTVLLILPVALLAALRVFLLAPSSTENPRWEQYLGESLYEGV